MLSGRFGDTSHRPYVEGLLAIPRLGALGTVSFLLDTGADGTFLMPTDGLTIGLDYSLLLPPVGGGISASSADTREHREEAVVMFTDGTDLLAYNIELGILPWDPDMQRIPSLLGRDILHRWAMTYDYEGRTLTFEAHTADVVIPAPGAFPEPGLRYQ